MSIGEKIKIARINLKLSQEEVSEKLNITRQTLSNWENDRFLPDILNVIKMSKLYDISLDELLKDENKIIEKLEKDTQKLKNYKTYYEVAIMLIFIASVLSLINKIFNFNKIIGTGFNIIFGICMCCAIVIFIKNGNYDWLFPEDILYHITTNDKIPKIWKFIMVIVIFIAMALAFRNL